MTTSRRTLLLGASAAGLLPRGGFAATDTTPAPAGTKTLRYAFQVAETGFDPVKLVDLYSRIITSHIFEAPYTYDHLARPIRIKPHTAAALPEISADFKVYTIRLKPGIFFADDPAFKGKPRELVAQDYVYTFQRYADPANKAQAWPEVESFNFVGLNETREEALAAKKPFDYARPLPGLKALDRHTLRLVLKDPRPRLIENLSDSGLYGAVAREVVEFYGGDIDAHPVGTGPFRLAQWRRSSRVVLEKNPGFREVTYDAEPAADDAEGQALATRFKGRRLPMVDRVEISIIEESQPRWLSFVNGESDFIEKVGPQFINLAMPGGKVAPNLAKRGVQGFRALEPGTTYILFNCDSAMVGGYAPHQVGLRRAIGLALDTPSQIHLIERDQAVPSQSPISPYTTGYDPQFRSAMSEFDPARAKALLDLFGYVDRDGDGWRERPDGSPLFLEWRTQADQRSRQYVEQWSKNLRAVGIRMVLQVAQWPENLKATGTGSYMVWSVGGLADVPDGQTAIARYDSRQVGSQNRARFRNADFDKIYDRLLALPDGPEREALFLEAKRIAVAFMPYKQLVSRIVTDMAYPWLVGYRRPTFWLDWWQYVDIDPARLPAA